ncbi:hypothetical protein [Dyella sp. C9]|uniref:hypothetical protein n=1 Tax=Dyella sp. C9 TaxID=2202154 RepID=UPI000DEFB6CA|nr:hypothetical protein [Dyella sp. C9]
MRHVAHPLSTIQAALLGCTLSATLTVARADDGNPNYWDGDWHGSIQPYGWLPGVSANTRFQLPNNGPSVEQKSSNSLLSNLSGAFMLDGTLRKGDWGMYGDIDWVDFSNEKGHFTNIGGQRFGASANLDNSWDMRGGMVNFAGLYTAAHGQQGYIDILVGVRYLWIKSSLDWNFTFTGNGGRVNIADSGNLRGQTHVTDGIVGIHGRWSPFPDKHWFFPYYLDVGGGGSDSTYQVMAGLAYGFSWGDIALNYRDVEYKASGSDEFLRKVELSGPSFSVTWHF